MTDHPALRLPWPVWTIPARDRGAERWREAVAPTLLEIRTTLLHPRAFCFEDFNLIHRLTTAMTVATPILGHHDLRDDGDNAEWNRDFWNCRANPADQNAVAAWLGQAGAVDMMMSGGPDNILEPRPTRMMASVTDQLMAYWRAQAWGATVPPDWCADLFLDPTRLSPLEELVLVPIESDQHGVRPWKDLQPDLAAFLQAMQRERDRADTCGAATQNEEQHQYPWANTNLVNNCLALKALAGVKPGRVQQATVAAVDHLLMHLDATGVPKAVQRRTHAEWDRLVLTRRTQRGRHERAGPAPRRRTL